MIRNRYKQLREKKRRLQEQTLGPSFDECRRTDDATHVADLGFRRQLWALDKELDVVWNHPKQIWEIWKFPEQSKKLFKRIDDQAKFIMAVQTKNKTFRELGADVLIKLQEFSFERYSVDQLCQYFDRQDAHIKAMKQKDFENKIEAITRESIDYIRGTVKRVVPAKIEAKDEKYLLNLVAQPKPNVKIFKPKTTQIIASAAHV
jgi:hypothetical protein